MNRDNVIHGQKIDRHPYSDREAELGVYVKGASVIAVQAQIAGIVKTPEGDMRFQAGDYIVTDNPPTHAWPVRQQVFEQTYNLSHMLEEGQFPTSEPQSDPEAPARSIPPTDVNQIKAQEIGMERAGAEDTPRALEPQVAQGAPKATRARTGTRATSSRKSDKHRSGIADSRSLGMEGS